MRRCFANLTAVGLMAAMAVLAGGVRAAESTALIVFAAAGLKAALDEQIRQFGGETNTPVAVTYGDSATLARQIESGARADVLISAQSDWMERLDARGLLAPGSRHDLFRDRLVLIAPDRSSVSLKIEPGFRLAAALGTQKLALADPDRTREGEYAREALQTLRVWPAVESNLARTDTAAAALAMVARGEARLGIVYASEARGQAGVRIVGVFAPSAHKPIRYSIAIVAGKPSASAQALVDFLDSALARGTWERFGFGVAR